MEEPNQVLTAALDDVTNAGSSSMLRTRSYTGQPWTDGGIRGKTQLQGITMRDVKDCFIRAFIMSYDPNIPENKPFIAEALKGEHSALQPTDVYAMQGSIDPIAVSQNLSCELEKCMGIYPNVPHMTYDTQTGLPEGTPIVDLNIEKDV